MVSDGVVSPAEPRLVEANGDREPLSNGIAPPAPPPADVDPGETREWLDSLDSVIQTAGEDRARFLLTELRFSSNRQGVYIPFSANTPYINSIPVSHQPLYPGNRE